MQRLAAALGLLALATVCQAQTAPAAVSSSASAPVRSTADAAPQLKVVEDDNVRIEETRLRGAPTRIVVHSKLPGVMPYEIQVAPGGRDRSQTRGSAGQSAWTFFSF